MPDRRSNWTEALEVRDRALLTLLIDLVIEFEQQTGRKMTVDQLMAALDQGGL
jgi:hypothetical protein